MKISVRFLAFAVVTGVMANAVAWNSVGHRIIAAIAQAKLSPKARAEADRLLAAAPNGASTDFIAVSTWADETRTRENGPWHYIDYYFRTDGQPPINKPDAENVVWAINRFSAVLADKTKPDAERAEALRFLIHFVGDIHQPLHATSRETADRPKGDRGGNDFHILAPAQFGTMERPPRNLHAFWDLGGGLFTPELGIQDEAKKLMQAHPVRSFSKEGDRNPDDWAHESLDISKSFVYNLTENQAPSSEYVAKSQEISGERVTLAGYRLADFLIGCFGRTGPPTVGSASAIMKPMPIWGVVNQKGGVGKTTTAVNLAAGLALRGKRTLLVDCDPQGNATTGLGVVKAKADATLYEVLADAIDNPDDPTVVRRAVVPVSEHLDLIPATLDLAGAEPILMNAVGKELILRDCLQPVREEYQWIILDAPPSLGILTINILGTSDGVLVPMQCEFYALEGLSQLVRTIEVVRRRINPGLRVAKVLLTMFDPRYRLTQQVTQEVREYFGDKVSGVVIPRNVRLSEAPGFGESAVSRFPTSKGAGAYIEFVDEVLSECAVH